MLLVFPTSDSVPVKNDDVKIIRSINQGEFDLEVKDAVSAGWTVYEMISKFRKTLFGGVISYKAELRRGETQQQVSST